LHGGETLQRRTLLNVDRLDTQRVDIGAIVVLGVRDCRLDNLLDDLRALFGAEGQNVERLLDRLAADEIRNQTTFCSDRRTPRRMALVSIVILLSAWPSCWRRDP
jgi:hypothetical protein